MKSDVQVVFMMDGYYKIQRKEINKSSRFYPLSLMSHFCHCALFKFAARDTDKNLFVKVSYKNTNHVPKTNDNFEPTPSPSFRCS